MKFARALLLLVAFQAEIRVKAVGLQETLWKPPGCSGQSVDCHAEVGSKKLEIKSEDGIFAFAAGALIERKNKQWKLLRGAVRTSGAAISTVYGAISKYDGEAWVLAEDDERIVVRAVSGSVQFTTRSGQDLEIPQGFEVWIGGLDAQGRNVHGVPAMIPVEDHLHRWVAMDSLSKDDLKHKVSGLRELWKNREEIAAELYGRVSRRNLASVAEKEARQAEKARAARAQRDEYRRLLHRTAFEK